VLYYMCTATYDIAMEAVRAKVPGNGQVSLPAELRRRWESDAVLVIDCGDYAIMRPLPDDPITALRGARSGAGPSTEQARAEQRADDAAREHERVGRAAR